MYKRQLFFLLYTDYVGLYTDPDQNAEPFQFQWQAVECRGQRLCDMWEEYVDNDDGQVQRSSLSACSCEEQTRQEAATSIVVLGCKFAKELRAKSIQQLHVLDPDILRLDTLQNKVCGD